MWTKGSKYKNRKVFNSEADRTFASGGENSCYMLHKAMELAGEIANLRCQSHVYLSKAKVHMIPDFAYFNVKDQIDEWAEFKGLETDSYRIKRRLWSVYGPGKLKVYKQNRGGVYLHETIIPKGTNDELSET